MGTTEPVFDTLGQLVRWCERAPVGTLLDARTIAGILTGLAPEDAEPIPPTEPVSDPPTWREKLWTVPAETRLGVREVAEALGRPRSYVYSHTGPKASDPLPHRRLDSAILFTAGELRAWIRDREDVVAAGPIDPPSRSLRAV